VLDGELELASQKEPFERADSGKKGSGLGWASGLSKQISEGRRRNGPC